MRRSYGIWILGGAILGLGVATARAEEHRMRPGQYELTTEMSMEGMEHHMPSRTMTHCYTDDEVKDNRRIAEQGQGQNHDCQVHDMKTEGNRVSWAMTCASGSKGTAEMTYTPDGYDMTLRLETEGGPHGPAKVKIHTTAKRTGDCH